MPVRGPYCDGNGRLGRLLINAMLASGGYPLTVIRLKQRAQYMAALEAASVGGDIKRYYLRPSYRLDHRALTQAESFCEGHTMSITDRLAHVRPQETMLAHGRTALHYGKLLPIFPGT